MAQAPYKRINFFKGFLTTEADWNDAERYHVEKRKLHNRALHAPGIVPGFGDELRVSSRGRGDLSIEVGSGYAIDAQGKTNILLVRVGEKRQGVVGLFQPGLPGEQSPGLSVRFMGIERNAIAQYLISLYCSLAILTPDAAAVLTDVDVTKYHEYP